MDTQMVKNYTLAYIKMNEYKMSNKRKWQEISLTEITHSRGSGITLLKETKIRPTRTSYNLNYHFFVVNSKKHDG